MHFKILVKHLSCFGDIVQLVRTPALQAGGRGFESLCLHQMITYMKVSFLLKKFCLFLAVFFFFSKNTAIAINSYYTEDYEKTNTYAGVYENDNIKINDNNHTNAQNNKARTIYNTIIVRRKNKTPQYVEQKVKKKQIPEITVKPVNDVNDRLKEYRNRNKKRNSILDNLFKTTPDRIYVYALAGYSITLSNHFNINAVHSSNITPDYQSFNPLSFSVNKKGSGFVFIIGTKIYLNKSKFAVFLAPELFYNKLNLNDSNFSYNSAHDYNIAAQDGVGIESKNIPATMGVKTKDMYGASLRVGFTLFNAISLYGKASIGGLRNSIINNLHINSIKDLDERIIEQWTNPENVNYISSTSQNQNKTSLFYSFGGGIEVGLLNQHIIFRLDYDYCFANSVLSTDVNFSRISKSKRGDNPTEGTKWRIKNNFGIVKFTAGFAF